MDSLFDRIQRVIQGKEDKPAKGFKTANEWAEKWKINPRMARKLLSAAVAEKLVEVRHYRRRFTGQLRPVPHYGEKS